MGHLFTSYSMKLFFVLPKDPYYLLLVSSVIINHCRSIERFMIVLIHCHVIPSVLLLRCWCY